MLTPALNLEPISVYNLAWVSSWSSGRPSGEILLQERPRWKRYKP